MDKNPLISIITVSYNSGEFIEDTINSVLNQTYDNIEHVVIDGKSNDKTVEIIKSYEKKYKKTKKNLKWVSEKDEGIYDGMNKGLKKANGKIIGFLNSEDFYANNNVIKNVISSFGDNKDIIFGNLDFIKGKNKDRVLRKYRAENFNRKKLKFGIAPPHNSIFMKSKLYEKYGSFKTDYTVSGDFEIFARIVKNKEVNYKYLDSTLVKMRLGGESTKNLKSIHQSTKELYRACRENNIKTNVLKVYFRLVYKLLYNF